MNVSFAYLPAVQFVIHYGLHLLLPGLVAYIFFHRHWKQAWLIMLSTMLVDLDHLLACSHSFPFMADQRWLGFSHFLSCSDLYVSDRCSIGFHPLHSHLAITIYFIMSFFRKTRLIAVGLLLHMITDAQDCLWM